MAQTISVLTVSNGEHDVVEVLCYAPSVEEVAGIAEDNEMFGDIDCEFNSYNIGEGESGTDFFFDEEELKEMYVNGNFEKDIESKGYDVNRYQSGTLSTTVKVAEVE